MAQRFPTQPGFWAGLGVVSDSEGPGTDRRGEQLPGPGGELGKAGMSTWEISKISHWNSFFTRFRKGE